VIALLLALALSAPVVRPLPVTPGVVAINDKTGKPFTGAETCAIKWGKDRRHVTLKMRKHVFAAYGIPYAQHARYEVDHLISRELGGADEEANLWPEPWDGPHGAHAKDRLENALHRAVCAGTLTLLEAQAAIRSDWIAAAGVWVRPRRGR
jgi:hypothetical protein